MKIFWEEALSSENGRRPCYVDERSSASSCLKFLIRESKVRQEVERVYVCEMKLMVMIDAVVIRNKQGRSSTSLGG